VDFKGMTVSEIRRWVHDTHPSQYPDILHQLVADQRAGVQKLYQACLQRLERWNEEKKRLQKGYALEQAAVTRGYSTVAGVDEAGRGPLAGPVVAAAVVLPPGFILEGLKDSKKMTAAQRERAYREIMRSAEVGIGVVGVPYIDAFNILKASFHAMRQAVGSLAVRPDYLLVDGRYPIPGLPCNQENVVGGDSLSNSIAAASIVAKVTRDRLMVKMDEVYPEYGFSRHKGYYCEEHIASLVKYGPCPCHRLTFCHRFLEPAQGGLIW